MEKVRMESRAVGPIAWMRLVPSKEYMMRGMEQPYNLRATADTTHIHTA